MQKKYFFFDIDGTLTDRRINRTIPSAIEAVHKLQEAGHFVSIATGRASYKCIPFARENGFRNMVCNGGHGIYIDGEMKENRPIDYEKSLAIYRQALELGYGVLVAADDSKKVYANSFRFYDQVGERKEPTTYIIDSDFDPANIDKIYKMYVSIPEEEEERLTLRDTVGRLRFVKEYLMFQPDDKKGGILRMMELVTGGDDAALDHVVVFGDDTNDMVMFDPRFYGVAMGNGTDELKAMANYVTDASYEDGIWNACVKHGWFEKAE
ncbi:MAG: HAD-IIB family hydrolase [Lachnospiraceae bacterium]|nr:HAD-IIB family hydrolase [Lachnospiraceae bacterium]